MECNDWDTVLQFTSESMDQNLVVDDPDKGLTRVEIPPITPVRLFSSIYRNFLTISLPECISKLFT